jgi:RNA polymerase sigma-70 factor (ECF subfamily)
MLTPVPDASPNSRLTPAEQELLARLRAGDRSVAQTLLRPLLPSLLGLSRRLVGDAHWAEDLVQETLVRAFRGLPDFAGRSSLRTWVLRILVRLASEPHRWRQREPARPLADLEIPDTLGPAPDASARERELHERLAEAMERLTPRQRTALHLRASEGLDYAAIAEVLGNSPAAARMLVLAARQRIRERMGRHLLP